MYLTKKTYVQNWEHTKKSKRHEIVIKQGGKIRKDIIPERITHIEEQVMYWRKANHIHAWFLRHSAIDDQVPIYVDRDDIELLIKDCKIVLKSLKGSKKGTVTVETGWDKDGKTYEKVKVYTETDIAKEYLPTQEGFFFGSTLYDDGYVQDLKDTIKTLGDELKTKNTNASYYYEASW